MSKIARETVSALHLYELAIDKNFKAGKENSQNQIFVYFERTAIGKPDFVFLHPQRKIGYPDCLCSKFSKSSDFGKTLYLLAKAEIN